MSFSNRTDQGYLSFAKGLVTEYNPLAAPEGTTFDELNMDVDTDGFIRTRRSPLEAVSITSLSGTPGVIEHAAIWEDQDKILVVLKREALEPETDNFLIDVMVYTGGSSPARDLVLYFSIPQDQYVQPTSTFLRKRALLILGGSPLLLEKAEESYSVYEINILVRDFKLLDDGLGTSNRSPTLSSANKYNLYNAGWWQERKLKVTSAVGDPVEQYRTTRGVYPGNADIAYLADVPGDTGGLFFDATAYDNIDFGSTEAPRGHYIFSIININRNTRLTLKTYDGSQLATLNPVLEDGDDPDTGLPPDPGSPITPPPSFCIPGEICEIEP